MCRPISSSGWGYDMASTEWNNGVCYVCIYDVMITVCTMFDIPKGWIANQCDHGSYFSSDVYYLSSFKDSIVVLLMCSLLFCSIMISILHICCCGYICDTVQGKDAPRRNFLMLYAEYLGRYDKV